MASPTPAAAAICSGSAPPGATFSRFRQKSRTYRGNTTYWIELEFNDKRKKLKIEQTIEGYPALRDILMSVFTAEKQS